MGDAEADSRTTSIRRPDETSGREDPLKHGVLSLHAAADGRPRVDFGGGYAGCERVHHHGLNVTGTIASPIVGSLADRVEHFLCYGFADRLARMLGPTAMTVIMQLVSFLLVCIGVQILWNGASALLASVHLATH